MSATHTFVILDLSPAAFDEISRKLKDAGYHQAFSESDGRDVIDMQGIAVACEPAPPLPGAKAVLPETPEEAYAIFARYGGVDSDPVNLFRLQPTPTQLAYAKARAIANGVPAEIVERAGELIR